MNEDRFLFRAWSIDTGRMHYDVRVPILYRDMIVMQCTGVTDRNHKLIFEGDIVEAWSQGSRGIFEVRWRGDGGGAPMWLLWPNYQGGEYWSLVAPHDFAATVIGNIYKYPKLRPKEARE